MISEISWVVTVMSIVGVVLNIKKKKSCFVIWSGTNGFWAVYDFYIGAYAQSALFTVYFVLAIYGLIEWGGSHDC